MKVDTVPLLGVGEEPGRNLPPDRDWPCFCRTLPVYLMLSWTLAALRPGTQGLRSAQHIAVG